MSGVHSIEYWEYRLRLAWNIVEKLEKNASIGGEFKKR